MPYIRAPRNVSAIPKTILDILRYAINSGGSEFDLKDAKSQGASGCLKRSQKLLNGIRLFAKLVRLEEGLLSQMAILKSSQVSQEQKPGISDWNLVQHELALARAAAGHSQSRISRSDAWAKAQTKFCEEVQTKNTSASADDVGLRPVCSYRPNRVPKESQVVAVMVDGSVQIALILSVYRGSIVRKAGAAEFGKVKTSKPVASELPAAATRMVHLSLMSYDKMAEAWVTSCVASPLLVNPVNAIHGELSTKSIRASSTRLHVVLTAAAEGALHKIQQGKVGMPFLHDADIAKEAEEAGPENPEPVSATPVMFNDRSFMRRNVEDALPRFFKGLRNAYKDKGMDFVVDGHVTVGGQKILWEDILRRIPGYFLHSCGDLQGYKFSHTVHNQVMQLLPKSILLDMLVHFDIF